MALEEIQPVYESDEDRRTEADIATAFGALHGWTPHKLYSKSYRVDYCMVFAGTDIVTAFVEAKRRKHLFGRHDTVMLGLAKWMTLCALRGQADFGSFFVVRFDDGDYAANIEPQRIIKPHRYKGRRDRDNPFDMEPCAHVPLVFFDKVRP